MKLRQRILWIMGVLCLGFSVVSLRLVYIQLFKNEELRMKAKGRVIKSKIISAIRGEILDRNGITLARTLVRNEVRIDPLSIPLDRGVAKTLSQALNVSRRYIKSIAKQNSRALPLMERVRLGEEVKKVKKRVGFLEKKKIEDLGFSCVSFKKVKQNEADLYEVYLDPWEMPRERGIMKSISTLLLIKEKRFEKIIYNGKNRNYLLKVDADEKEVLQLEALEKRKRFHALKIKRKHFRTYPHGTLASHVIGFINDEDVKSGVESVMDADLCGIDGREQRAVGKRGYTIPRSTLREIPKNGRNVRLSLDIKIQNIIEEELDSVVENYQPESACVIVMHPKTGEVLAMSSRPTFNPNRKETRYSDCVRNRCLEDSIEPGSTFKIVTLASVINEGLATLNTHVNCERGVFYYEGLPLRDSHPMGTISLIDVFAKSSNIGSAKLAIGLEEERGREVFYRYIRGFGFGQKTNILGGQAESVGILHSTDKWPKVEITRIAIGQAISVTPIQMINAVSVIANGGYLMMPRIIQKVESEDGAIYKEYTPKLKRRVIEKRTAKAVSKALLRVVSSGGTGGLAAVMGFDGQVAGKTGTAQKPEAGGYSEDKYVASFVGYLPERDPQFVVLVIIDSPQGGVYAGGKIAAPVFSRVSGKVAKYLNIRSSTAAQEPYLQTTSYETE